MYNNDNETDLPPLPLDNNPSIACKVCNMPTDHKLRCGAQACDACKKFFLRNFWKLGKMRCSSGVYDCLSSITFNRTVQTSAGVKLRLICSRCRLARCFEIGMKTKKDPSTLISFSSSSSASANSNNNEQKQQKAESSVNNSRTTVAVTTTKEIITDEAGLLLLLSAYLDQPNVANNPKLVEAIQGHLQAICQFSDFATNICSLELDNPSVKATRIETLCETIRYIEETLIRNC